jgi:hypothetical protein
MLAPVGEDDADIQAVTLVIDDVGAFGDRMHAGIFSQTRAARQPGIV